MKKMIAAAAALALLGACAKNSKEVAATYVSPINYQSMSCNQLRQEAVRVSQRVQSSMTTQDQKAGDDAALMAVTLVLFWPAAFFINGDDANSVELGRLKGEFDAIEQANIRMNCGIQFGRSQ